MKQHQNCIKTAPKLHHNIFCFFVVFCFLQQFYDIQKRILCGQHFFQDFQWKCSHTVNGDLVIWVKKNQ